MHSRLLRHFLAVVDCKGVTAAAAELNITQPALTKSVRQLEDILGVDLFERMPTGVVPTRFGEILARRARLMDIEYRHAVAEIQAIKGGTGGIVNVGAGPVWAEHILPSIIAAFRRQQPKVKIKLTTGVIDTLVPALLCGELDVICSALDFPAHPEFVKEHLLGLQHVLIARPQHPLAQGQDVSATNLLEFPWISLVNDYVGHSRINSFFAANELRPPSISVEVTSTSAALNLLHEDDFILNIPTIMLPYAESFGMCKLSVRGILWDAPAGIAYRATKASGPAVSAFCALVRAKFVGARQSQPRIAENLLA